MSENLHLVCLTIVTAGVTFLLRAFPFLAFGQTKDGRPPKIVSYLGRMVSPAAIAMLVVYCFCSYFKDRSLAERNYGIVELTAKDIVRHELVQRIVEAYENKDRE